MGLLNDLEEKYQASLKGLYTDSPYRPEVAEFLHGHSIEQSTDTDKLAALLRALNEAN